MAQQGISRREVMRMLSTATIASQFQGFSVWAFAHEEHSKHSSTSLQREVQKQPYKPRCFSATEFETLSILTSLILPTDETPGAKESGANEFVDFMASYDKSIQAPLRQGIAVVEAKAKALHASEFKNLNVDQQISILEMLADPKQPGTGFFLLLREYTVMGHYTSQIGLESLKFPGLTMAYSVSPKCPHTDDPEHKFLHSPKIRKPASERNA